MEIRKLLMQLHEKRDLSTCLKSSALDRKYQGKNTAFFFYVTILCSFFNFIYC